MKLQQVTIHSSLPSRNTCFTWQHPKYLVFLPDWKTLYVKTLFLYFFWVVYLHPWSCCPIPVKYLCCWLLTRRLFLLCCSSRISVLLTHPRSSQPTNYTSSQRISPVLCTYMLRVTTKHDNQRSLGCDHIKVYGIRHTIRSPPQTRFRSFHTTSLESCLWRRAKRIAYTVYSILLCDQGLRGKKPAKQTLGWSIRQALQQGSNYPEATWGHGLWWTLSWPWCPTLLRYSLVYSGRRCPSTVALKWVPLKICNSSPVYNSVNV